MTTDEIKHHFLDALSQIAPEADLTQLSSTAPLREQLDIDSFDFLRLMVALHEQLHVEIPERDYRKLASLDGAVGYLAARLDGRS